LRCFAPPTTTPGLISAVTATACGLAATPARRSSDTLIVPCTTNALRPNDAA